MDLWLILVTYLGINTTDEDMYKARDKRSVVVDSIMNMLDQAVEHLKLRSAVGVNRLNKESALIYKSRVALFEATWAKYHKGTPSASDVDANKYFQVFHSSVQKKMKRKL